MSVVDNLLVVQQHDIKIRDLKREMHDIPARKKEEETRLRSHTQALAEAEESLKAKQSEVKQLELEVDSSRERISKLRQQQLELKTNKEFKAVETEIKTIEDGSSSIEDRQLGLMEEVEGARQIVEEKKAALKKEEEAVLDDVKHYDERLATIEGRLKDEEGIRTIAAKDVDPEWLQTYERIIARKDEALVLLDNGVCGGCHMTLPRQVVHNAKKHLAMVTCDMCGRLLY